ncbi:unnamed protein product, partial [Protopolystoma xenopodis]
MTGACGEGENGEDGEDGEEGENDEVRRRVASEDSQSGNETVDLMRRRVSALPDVEWASVRQCDVVDARDASE